MHLFLNLVTLLTTVAGAAAASIADCPGYTASNVVHSATGLTADLKLAGTACNVYGYDLGALKLLVEYQTGTYIRSSLVLLITLCQILDYML